jgi:hypothetical protein
MLNYITFLNINPPIRFSFTHNGRHIHIRIFPESSCVFLDNVLKFMHVHSFVLKKVRHTVKLVDHVTGTNKTAW